MKRDKFLAQFHKRWNRVIKLREKGKTWQEIGDALGVSRQRAAQLYKQGINK